MKTKKVLSGLGKLTQSSQQILIQEHTIVMGQWWPKAWELLSTTWPGSAWRRGMAHSQLHRCSRESTS